MLPDFKLKEDWFIQTDILGIKNRTLLFSSGHVFKPTEEGEYHIIHGGWTQENPNVGARMILSVDEMRSSKDDLGNPLFQELTNDSLKMNIEEINDGDEDLVKNWRIQLDVKTSMKKLKKIQVILEKEIKEILEL